MSMPDVGMGNAGSQAVTWIGLITLVSIAVCAPGLARAARGAEEPALRSEVGAGRECSLNILAHSGDQAIDVAQGDLALALEDLPHIVPPQDRRDVPLLDIADALGVLQPHRRHQRDVAEPAARHAQDRALVRVGGLAGGGGEVLKVVLAEWPELLEIVGWVELRVVERPCRHRASK